MARGGLTLGGLGEDAALEALLRVLPSPARLPAGPGDDCAAVAAPGARDLLLLKTDCVVEGVHYTPDELPARVGRKALCRALSDIAAMGGRPAEALVTIFCRRSDPIAYWKAVYRGIAAAARRYGVVIAGGEMSSAPARALVVALTGWVPKKRLILRSGGRPGDVLLVTGRLGGSRRRKHWAFDPRLAEGRWLASRGFAMAMVDLSDGLGSDLPRLARASRCGYELDTIPCTRGCSVQEALSDGEDYELLVAVRPRRVAELERAWKRAFPSLPLTAIGRLTGRPGAGREPPVGFDHFALAGRRKRGDPLKPP